MPANIPRSLFSSSGMATGGRILHHLSTNVCPIQENLMLFIGFPGAGDKRPQLSKAARRR